MNTHRNKNRWLAGLVAAGLILSACSSAETQTDVPMGSPTPTMLAAQASPTMVAEPTMAASTTSVETQVEATMPVAQTEPTATAQAVLEDAASFPDPDGFAWNLVVSGLVDPLGLVTPPDDSGRMFVLEQAGLIRIVQDGSLLPEPFLDISGQLQRGGNEQGLLDIAFHPNFASNGFFYVNYTSLEGVGDTRISRFQVSSNDPNRADPQSETVLLVVKQPFANHNGGQLAFGPDGYLYIGLGDGGSANDPQGNGQSLDTLLGKLLRIDVDAGDPYGIPAENPFAGGGGRPEIWAYGLRNPWRFSFDQATGDLYIADVGQNQWEEVDYHPAGEPGGVNYGWDYREAAHALAAPPAGEILVDPVFEYDHSQGCSITGGYVYRGQSMPEFNGIYLFGDFCSGKIWGMLSGEGGAWQTQELYQTGSPITSFGQDNAGEVYLIDRSGSIFRLERK